MKGRNTIYIRRRLNQDIDISFAMLTKYTNRKHITHTYLLLKDSYFNQVCIVLI